MMKLQTLRAAAPDLDVAPWTDVQPLLVLTEKVNNVVLLIWFAVVFAAWPSGSSTLCSWRCSSAP